MSLSPIWLWIAASGALVTWAVHTFLGQIYIVPPLLAASMHPVPKYTHFYCWHLVTIALALLVAAYVWAALDPGAWELALLGTVFAAVAALWSAGLVLAVRRHKPWQMPPWALFGATAIAGGLAFL
jgi:hypothetical protein